MTTSQTRVDSPVAYSAGDYDRYTARFVQVYDAIAARRVIQAFEQRPEGDLLLDVGTGTGQLLMQLAKMPQLRRLRMIGLDYFNDMVECARRNVDGAGLADRIRITFGDVHALAMPDCSVDIVISRSTVHHWKDPALALREIHRVLVPNGVAFIHDLRRDAPEDVIAAFNDARKDAGVPRNNMAEKYTVEEIRAFVEQAGLMRSCSIRAPAHGAGSIGMELRIKKSRTTS